MMIHKHDYIYGLSYAAAFSTTSFTSLNKRKHAWISVFVYA